MRIGYFGGTFDPPHRGHLRAAVAAADAFRLDQVLLAPTGSQPLKATGPFCSFEDRMTMVRLLCGEDARLLATDVDAPRADGAPNYTVDALDRLRIDYPDSELFVVTGADAFLSLPQWREPDRLLGGAEWIVVSRPGFATAEIDGMNLTEAQRARVHVLEDVHDETSASGLRERLRLGISCGDMLTPKVALYIARMHLYRGDR